MLVTQAAKNGEVEHVELVYEPQCAAAYYLYNIKDGNPKQLVVGDVMLIADIGGGTGDFVSYELKSDCDDGAKVGLVSTGEAEGTFSNSKFYLQLANDSCTGALCGSEFVNQQFIDWLKKHPDGFKAQCRVLGLTPAACIAKAAREFEGKKLEFSVPGADPQDIVIRGAQGAMKKKWIIEITR